ncbi:MAG TPA: HAD family hydrolase [Solirubrobacteraceae bacterium]
MSPSPPRSRRPAAGALLLDALGTLVSLEPPAPRLREQLATHFGVDVSQPQAERAIAAEISFYRAHLQQGKDPRSLARLRRGCAQVLLDALPSSVAIERLDPEQMVAVLLASLQFSVFADVRPALAAARSTGRRLIVVSNWDVSLHEVLERLGVGTLVDGILTSAEFGERKPSPSIFRRAVEMAGVRAAEAMHVGDSLEEDVAGARAAGIEAVLLARAGAPTASGVRVISSLQELERGP